MFDIFDQAVAYNIINVVTAVIILIVGWVVALFIASAVRGGIRRTKLGEHLKNWSDEEDGGKPPEVENWISKAVFYIIMIFVLIAFFQYLNLTVVAEPLNRFLTQIFSYLPMLFGASILLLIAWVVATLLKKIVQKALITAKIDERLDEKTGDEKEKATPLSQTISMATYWLVFLLFLPAILSALKLEGLLLPVQNMTDRVLSYLPHLIAAALILVFGWYLARILQRIVSALLVAVGLDRLSERIGLAQVIGEQKMSNFLGLLINALVLIVTIIAALNALALEAITQPASNMLNMILEALPAIFAATLVVLIAYLVARVVKQLISNVLTASGFNSILMQLGVTGEPAEGKWTPAEVVGYVVLVIVMLFASIEAAGLLGFGLLAGLVSQLLVFISHVALGLAIFAIGLYLANLAAKVIKVSNTPEANILAKVARFAILVLAGAMALQRMGLANEIILIAFGLLLGTVAITVILAFGIGGKEVAAKQLEEWINTYKSDKS